ncbi:transposase [Allorhizocola rhizosphaerae]|uniref:transposase n=1 Tax=Allorhizocola rhizosphaerae TaxID=1872709 RepID=UPI001FE6744E|nr:transposase [Allorhizocola rhizosphaerae]
MPCSTPSDHDIVGRTRRQLASELITELAVIDKKIKTANRQLTELVAATGGNLLRLNGIGPSGAARLLGDIVDISRFADRGHFASWNGTASLEASSGNQQRHRLSRAGNRRINRVLHIMAVVQLRHDTEGRRYFRRKLAAGKTAMEAMRAVKRRLSNVVYQQMLTDAKTSPGGQPGATLTSSAVGSTPTADSSDKPLPGLDNHDTPPQTPALTSTVTRTAAPSRRRSLSTS